MGGTGAAPAGAELERNRAALAALVAEVEGAIARLPAVSAADWSGPASWAFRGAVGTLRREIASAGVALRDAQQLTDIAARELALRVG